MRTVIFVLILGIVVFIGLVASGFLNISQIRGGKAPQLSATRNGVTAKGGQAPAFEVETGSVKLGSKQTTVSTPTVVIQKPDNNQAAAATNNAM